MGKSNAKKVLFISHDNNLFGATRSMIDLAYELRKRNFSVYIIIPSKGVIEQELKKRNLPYQICFFPLLVSWSPKSRFLDELRRLLIGIKHLPALVKHIRIIKPDMIYLNTIANYWLLAIRLIIRTPIALHIREFDNNNGFQLDFNGLLFKTLKTVTKNYLANSKAIKSHYDKKFKLRAKLIYNGVLSQTEFDRNKKLKQKFISTNSRDMLNIGIVGAIGSHKGQLEVVKAFMLLFKNYGNVRLVIVGEGERKEIEELAKENNFQDALTITGFVADVDQYYLEMDILVMNSRMEGFGRVAVEAASFGIPVLACSSGASQEIIVNGKTGLLHDGSKLDIFNKLETLVRDKDLRSSFGLKGWQYAKEHFSLEDSVKKLHNIFIQLLKYR